jgi:hypothetical protein
MEYVMKYPTVSTGLTINLKFDSLFIEILLKQCLTVYYCVLRGIACKIMTKNLFFIFLRLHKVITIVRLNVLIPLAHFFNRWWRLCPYSFYLFFRRHLKSVERNNIVNGLLTGQQRNNSKERKEGGNQFASHSKKRKSSFSFAVALIVPHSLTPPVRRPIGFLCCCLPEDSCCFSFSLLISTCRASYISRKGIC